MTFYEVACYEQHLDCVSVDRYYEGGENDDPSPSMRQIFQGAVDRAYVLGLMIDAMPVELAEKEV